ncbi:MAG: YihY/virulence factor BrkB family protein [Thermomicrobiales bacterium]
MVLRIDTTVAEEVGVSLRPVGLNGMGSTRETARRSGPWQRIHRPISRAFFWALRGYQEANAGDLAAAVAFNALVALVPTFLLCLSVAGLVLKNDEVLTTTIHSLFWGLPSGAAGDALEAALTVRRNSGWLGALSLTIFAWTGAGFVSCLARSMNRIYGVPNCGYMCEKRRGFFVVLAFAFFFILAVLASTVPTLFLRARLEPYFEDWPIASPAYQALGYGVALAAAAIFFGMLYRIIPNAGQTFRDVWPGMLTAAFLFVLMAQIFPLYLRLIGGANRYGTAFVLITLLVAWFYALAHLILFGTHVNVTHQRRRRVRRTS